MTYQGALTLILALMILVITGLVLQDHSGPGGVFALPAMAAVTPADVAVSFNSVDVAQDGAMYFMDGSNTALVRDPDGNLRTIPSTHVH